MKMKSTRRCRVNGRLYEPGDLIDEKELGSFTVEDMKAAYFELVENAKPTRKKKKQPEPEITPAPKLAPVEINEEV